MSEEAFENWKKIKTHMESIGNTDNYFYTRACAIVAGNVDPLEPPKVKELE